MEIKSLSKRVPLNLKKSPPIKDGDIVQWQHAFSASTKLWVASVVSQIEVKKWDEKEDDIADTNSQAH